MPGNGGLRLAACDEAALALGLRPGERLADARAKVRHLASAIAEPEKDAALLLRLARWSERWSPWIALDPPDGLFLDVTGIPHLFGGEEVMLADIAAKFRRLGFAPRLALAGTPAAAWAIARFGTEEAHAIAPDGERAALACLPVQALKLDEETVRTLRRLGLKTVESLYGIPRASLARRFRATGPADAVLARLDEALGLRESPLGALKPPPAFVARAAVVEPVLTPEGVAVMLDRLTEDLAARLEAEGRGAVRLMLALYRVDGSRAAAPAGLGAPSRDPKHLFRLIGPKLERLDLGFGIEAATLAASVTAPCPETQAHFLGERERTILAELADRVANRVEGSAFARLQPIESHLPERAEREVAAASGPAARLPRPGEGGPRRPLLLFDRPEAVAVIAEVPEGPPKRFTWRKVARKVARAEGPERIAPEWWRGDKETHVRDYYVVEDEEGRRYWLYRLGLFGDVEPAWFLHGLFP